MAADIVPVRLGLTKGDHYTLWAPRWRDAGDEWEAFLGKDEDLYAFDSVADLVAFVRTNSDNDLTDHPAWKALTEASAHKLDPTEDRQFDIVGVADVVTAKPTEESVRSLHQTLAVVSAIGSVCDLTAVAKFFNGNPVVGTLSGGVDAFTGRSGRKRWSQIAEAIGRAWDSVVDAIDELVDTPKVDSAASEKAAAELAEPAPQSEDDEEDAAASAEDEPSDEGETASDMTDQAGGAAAQPGGAVLGGDDDFWLKVGIDPIRMITSSGTFFTLRCYLDEQPIFLGRNGRISVFGSERALARYLADEHDHDLSDLATYDDIRTAATDGSLEVDVDDDNVYVLSGLTDDITDGPDAVDRDQLELAVELLRDVGEYAEDTTVDKTLDDKKALGRFVAHVLDPKKVRRPKGPHVEAVEQWEALERFLDSRLRSE